MDATDKSAMASADSPRATSGKVAAVGEVMGVVVFLTSSTFDRVVVCMRRRVLQVRTAFEATRSSAQQLQLAYQQVVETVRHNVKAVADVGDEDAVLWVATSDPSVASGSALAVGARSTTKGAS